MKTGSQIGSRIVASIAVGMAIASAGCATTDMTSTWTDPSAKGAALSKVAVICVSKDDGLRRMAEDTAASQLQGAQAVPSYRVLGDTDPKNKEAVKAKLKEQGFQGVLVMRVAGVSEQVNPIDYDTFDGYYGYAAGVAYDPGFVQTDTVVHVVSKLYSLRDNKLIWSGVSQTFDPASASSFMTDVSKAVAKSIQKDRLVL
jgi:nitrogen regulatory protein PII